MSILGLALAILLTGGVVKDDFLVNPGSPNKCTKDIATVAALPHGWFVVWEDTRNARESEEDLYGQFLSTSLVPSGGNRMITSDSTRKSQVLVCAASDSAGNTVVLWRAAGDSGEFWLRKVSPSGELLMKDTLLFAIGRTSEANLAMNPSGEFAITWRDPQPVIGLIVFDANGKVKYQVAEVATVDDPNIKPCVAIASNGAVIVTWYRNGSGSDQTTRIKACCYKPNGDPRGGVFQVAEFSNELFPPFVNSLAVGCDHAGMFVLSWVVRDIASQLVPYALYYRTYSWDGTASGDVKIIYKLYSNLTSISPHQMVVGWDGSFTVAWSDERTGKLVTYLQNFLADGSPRGPELTLSEDWEEGCMLKALALNADQWMAVYSRQRNGFYEMLGRRGMVYGSMLGNEIKISDDESSVNEVYSQVLADDEGNFTALWSEDWYHAPAYCRRFSADGDSLGDALPLKDTSGVSRLVPQYYARASMNRKSGDFVLVFKRASDPQQICVQRYTKYGYPSGNEKLVSCAGNFFNTCCDVSVNRKGAFAVIWNDTVQGSNTLKARRFDKDNLAIDATPVLFGVPVVSGFGYIPHAIFLKDDNSFVTAWKEKFGIMMQRFNSSGKPLGDTVRINEAPSGVAQKPAIAVDDEGTICVAWADSAYGLVQFYDAHGEKLGENKNTGILLGGHNDISVAALPQGGFLVYGTDYSNSTDNPDVSAVYYHPDGTPWSRKVQVNDPDLFCFNYQAANYNSVAAGGDRIVYVWQDNRRHKGWDIYAKVVDLEVPGVDETSKTPSPITLSTSLNRVSYCVAMGGEALLDIFSVDGRRVERLVVSGSGTWDPGFLPSGVYFARLVQGTLAVTGKVLVVK